MQIRTLPNIIDKLGYYNHNEEWDCGECGRQILSKEINDGGKFLQNEKTRLGHVVIEVNVVDPNDTNERPEAIIITNLDTGQRIEVIP